MSRRPLSSPATAAIAGLSARRDARDSNSSTSTTSSLFWNRYKGWIRRHRSSLLLWESFLDRLIWWYPGQGASSSNTATTTNGAEGNLWRQVLWSWAELQHLAIDLALHYDDAEHDNDGMTLDTTHVGGGGRRGAAALMCRIALTIVHSLWPVVYDSLQTTAGRRPGTDVVRRRGNHHQAYWELQMERIRFACRLAIMIPHWWRIRELLLSDTSTTALPGLERIVPGILQQGGLLPSLPRPTVQQEIQRLRRLSYVGRRTGRNVLQHHGENNTDNWPSSPGFVRLRILLGEVLHILRPLFWAHCKYKHYVRRRRQPHSASSSADGPDNGVNDLWHAWLWSLGLDVASLLCLQPCRGQEYGNAATMQELQHRRLRLLLYLLRAPCSDEYTDPLTEKMHSWLTKSLPLPWLGSLLAAYLRDWLYYWKVYRLEE